MRRAAFPFFGLGDRNRSQEGIRISRSNDNVRISNEVSQVRYPYYWATAMQEYSARERHELRPFHAGRATLHLKAVGF
jgi:hypothetical protein